MQMVAGDLVGQRFGCLRVTQRGVEIDDAIERSSLRVPTG